MSPTVLLSLLVFLPLAVPVVLYGIPAFAPEHDHEGERARIFTLIATLGFFLLSLALISGFDISRADYQFLVDVPWITKIGVHYKLGVDGISLPLLILTTFLMPIIVVSSKSIHERRRGYLASMMVLQSAMTGTILALDLFLFYVFWEFMLAPMYFIIGIWGGKRKIYATLKFVLYTVAGSVLMLAAILYLVWRYQGVAVGLDGAPLGPSFVLSDILANQKLTLTEFEEMILFAAFALAFGIKVPIFPFHTWLPDAHVEAPTGGSVVLAGVLLKMGLYGFLRFAYPLFPRAAENFGPLLAVLAVIGIVYGALVAWAQTDIKKLIAYSSVSHLGFCVLGVVSGTVLSVTGSIYQMLNHGVSTGALFLLVGVLYDRKHTRLIADYGGLASKVPVFSALFLVFTMSSIALPLTNGFVGEFMILCGSFRVFPWLTGVAVSGVILGAIYMLTLYMKTVFGELDEAKNGDLEDVKSYELASFAPLLVLVFVMGIFPQPILEVMQPTIKEQVRTIALRRERLRENEFTGPPVREPFFGEDGVEMTAATEVTGTRRTVHGS